eukprot:8528077-Alexandrium_andersonii.AAC.1
MSASLVGSEMCIRDSASLCLATTPHKCAGRAQSPESPSWRAKRSDLLASQGGPNDAVEKE